MEEEIKFYKYVPTVWNESHYIKGEIVESIVVTREKDKVWHIGIATELKDWKDNFALDFLDKKRIMRQLFIAIIYRAILMHIQFV